MASHSFSFRTSKPADDRARFFSQYREFSRAAGWSSAISTEIELILEEWWTNLESYALAGRANPLVVVQIQSNGARAVIEVRDNGVPFDPTSRQVPDLEMPIEERPIGGLGIFMIKKLTSSILSERIGEENVLRLEKDLLKPILGQSKK